MAFPLPVAPQDALLTAGPQAGHILDLWRLTVFTCTGVFTVILLAFLYAVWRAPRSHRNTPADVRSLARPETGLTRKVIWATAVCTALLLGLIVASVFTDRALACLKLQDALHIEVTAHQWWWELRYSDAEASRMFTTANELHVPVGRPVILSLKSDDVIHSLWVPGLAGKKDLIPGRTATLTLRADRAGTYRGQCAEFCGAQHAWMAFLVTADPPDRFEAWAAGQRQSAPPPTRAELARGQALFMAGTCAMCHTITGTNAN
ncbi:MAG: cytochrome c oxidase subunit II, partial [Rubrivivax sp.]